MKSLFAVAGLLAMVLQAMSATLPLQCINGGNNLFARYFENADYTNQVASDFNVIFNLNVGAGVINPSIVGTNQFSAIWSGTFTPATTGNYRFKSVTDDGGRLSIDGVRVVGKYSVQNIALGGDTSAPIFLEANQPYLFQYEYYEDTGLSEYYLTYNIEGGSFINFTASDFTPCHFAPRPIATIDCSSASPGLTATYYNHFDFTLPVATVVTLPSSGSQWSSVGTPHGSITDPNDFSVIWKGSFTYPTTGLIAFAINEEEYVNVWVDGFPVLSNSQLTGFNRRTNPFHVEAGKYYSVEFRWMANPNLGGVHPLSFKIQDIDAGSTFNARSGTHFRTCGAPGVDAPIRTSMHASTSAVIPVTLKTQPATAVTVQVVTTGSMEATPCTLVFSTSNWNVPQYVYATTPVVLGQQITFNPSSTDPNYNTALSAAKTWVHGTPEPCGVFVPGATCTSWGDPHIVTFDGFKYDLHEFQDIYLVRHRTSELIIQARQGACGSGLVACNYAVAIKYQNALIRVFISSITGVPVIDYNVAAKNLGGLTVAKVGSDYHISLPNEIQVDVHSSWWATGKTYYMSVYTTVPTSYQTKLRGICGTYDGNTLNEFHLADGSTTTFDNHVSTWIVPANQKLLNQDYTIPKLVSLVEDVCSFSPCTAPPPLPPPCTIGCTPSPPPPVPECSYTLAEAQAACQVFISSAYAIACAGIGVDTTSWFNLCVQEAMDMCSDDSVPDQACAFQLACSSAPVPQCPCLCNLQGACVADGICDCTPPNTGTNCENDPNSTPCSLSVFPTSGAVGKVVTVYIAELPLGATYECSIDGKVSVAKFLTANSVSCPIPLNILPGTYPVTVLANGLGDNCGAEFTVTTGGGGLDPHFNGFNGENMEIKRDSNAANQLFHLYCSESITITTLFYEYEDKLLFMTKFWVKLGETLFTLNLSPKPKILTAHGEPVFIEELGRYRVTIPDGHLEWDDSKLRVVYKYLRINFSSHIYLQGSAYMNVEFFISKGEIESPVTGIVGRTLHNTLTTEEFETYLQFKAPVADVITFKCSTPPEMI